MSDEAQPPAPLLDPESTFACGKFSCRLRVAACLRRQLERVKLGNHPPKPAEPYCGSGACVQGLELQRAVGREALVQLRAQLAAKSPKAYPEGAAGLELPPVQPPPTPAVSAVAPEAGPGDDPSMPRCSQFNRLSPAQVTRVDHVGRVAYLHAALTWGSAATATSPVPHQHPAHEVPDGEDWAELAESIEDLRALWRRGLCARAIRMARRLVRSRAHEASHLPKDILTMSETSLDAVAPPTPTACSQCEKPARRRGFCMTHYRTWLEAHPTKKRRTKRGKAAKESSGPTIAVGMAGAPGARPLRTAAAAALTQPPSLEKRARDLATAELARELRVLLAEAQRRLADREELDQLAEVTGGGEQGCVGEHGAPTTRRRVGSSR